MLLNLPIILSRNSFESTYYSQILPTKTDLLTKIYANLLINIKRIIRNYKQLPKIGIKHCQQQKISPSAATKMIVGLSLYQ